MRRRSLAAAGAVLVAGLGWTAPLPAQSAADSTLAAACAGGGRIAEGLLLVVFGSGVSAAQRGAIVREVGGRLAGDGPDGGQYVTLGPDGLPPDAAADRLILADGVQSVGEAACPPPPAPADTMAPADTTAPADTSAAADTTAATDTTAPGRPPAPADSAPGP